MIKLIASDLDGTLLQNNAQELSEQIVPYIQRLKEMGILFVAASGRQYANLQRLFGPVKDDIAYVCENGALVIYQGHIIHKTVIDKDIGEEILVDIRQRTGCEILLSGMNTSYLEPKSNEYAHRMQNIVKNNVTIVKDILNVTENYLKISVYEREGIHNSEEYFRDKWGDRVTVVTSGTEWLDMISLHTNKGNALKILQQKFNITPDQTMAFGDNYNDVEMLADASYNYAINSGKQDIINLCKFATDRVEPILEKVINGKIQ
ncbi:MAG: Cof-type HAD-IIB family hydrolase [Lachnotalea sp.]